MPRQLRLTFDPSASPPLPRYDLDGEPVPALSLKHVPFGGGVWIDGEPQFDLEVYKLDGAMAFTVPPEADAPDWYERLATGNLAFVDWGDEETVRSTPLLDWKRVQRLPGAEALRWRESLGRIQSILLANVRDLMESIEVWGSPGSGTQGSPGLPAWEDVERLLHNTVASMKSRVDLTRGLVRSWPFEDGWVAGDYQRRVDELVSHDVVPFFHELRNYILHHRLVTPTSIIQVQAVPGLSVVLSTGELLDHGWSARERAWIASHGEHLVLAPALREYMGLINAFDAWLDAEFQRQSHGIVVDFMREVAEHAQRHPAEPPKLVLDFNALAAGELGAAFSPGPEA
jgi:hypothetical protein